jgi:hypothetical protein
MVVMPVIVVPVGMSVVIDRSRRRDIDTRSGAIRDGDTSAERHDGEHEHACNDCLHASSSLETSYGYDPEDALVCGGFL